MDAAAVLLLQSGTFHKASCKFDTTVNVKFRVSATLCPTKHERSRGKKDHRIYCICFKIMTISKQLKSNTGYFTEKYLEDVL